MNNLAERLKELRGAQSREIFAKNIGIRALANYEYSQRTPKADVITHICARLGVNSEWLLTGEGEKFAKDENSRHGCCFEKGLKNQHIDFIDNKKIEQKETAATAAISDLNADILRRLFEAMDENKKLQAENAQLKEEIAALKMDIVRREARIHDLEDELMRTKKALRLASFGSADSGGGAA